MPFPGRNGSIRPGGCALGAGESGAVMRVVTQQALSVRKLREQVGAEATGVDLTAPVDEPTRLRLCDAVARHGCLVIRDQRFDAHAILAAGRLFGEPVTRRYANPLPG